MRLVLETHENNLKIEVIKFIGTFKIVRMIQMVVF